MTLTPKILAIIQKAGTAVFNADVALKDAVADSARKVSDALTRHPFDGQHDSLYQNWKYAARISQAMSTIEAELKSLYALAAAAPATNGPAIALPAPPAPASAPLEVLNAIDVTDVVAKRLPAGRKGHGKSAKRTRKQARQRDGQDNTAKVLAHLQKLLNDQSFTRLNQTAVATAIGLPKGSIGASIKKLLQDGKLVQGEGKDFKLSATST